MSQGAGAPAIDSVDELPQALRQPLRDLILVLADSKRILGIRYADWVLGAPELEACIAASSLAQDEWGHSRILYALLKDFGDDPAEIERGREPSGYVNVEALDAPLEGWADFVIANAVTDTAITVQLQALTDSRYSSLGQRTQKQLDEERFHQGHGAAWLRRLATASDATREALEAALDRVWRPVIHWHGPDDHGADFRDEGLCDATGGELRARFLERVRPVIEDAGLTVPDVGLDFSDWDPAARRFTHDGPDGEAVARARGDANRAFLLE